MSTLAGFNPTTRLPIIEESNERLVGRKMVGGRLLLASPTRGLDIGGSVIHIGDLKQMTAQGRRPYSVGDTATFLNGRFQFQRGKFTGRAEIFSALTDRADVGSWYLEASHRITKRWQVAAQYEKGNISLLPGDNSLPPPLKAHESIGGALNFWFTPEFVIKLNAYHVDGNMLTRPDGAIVKYLTGTLNTKTNVAVLGSQFSF